jgi:RNA polymerase sigma-70 factor (family 1)
MTSYPLHNESDLVSLFQQGHEGAFTQLYHNYSEPLYYNILKLVKNPTIAEELVQDIFARIWQRRAQVNPEGNFGGYLFRISRNSVIDFFRQLQKEQAAYSIIREAVTKDYLLMEEALLDRENEVLMHKAVASLAPQRKRAWELCKVNGLSYEQAAQEMGVALPTVKAHMAAAREGIKSYLLRNTDLSIGLLTIIALKSV